MGWKQWSYGLANAIVSGAANGVVVIIADPEKFNLTSWAGFLHMLAVAGVGALVGFWMYLKQSPLPSLVETTVTTKESTIVTEKAVDPPAKPV